MIVAAIIITVNYIPLTKSDLVFAGSAYQSAYNHGVSDANKMDDI
jgi:hypothetical protein